MSLKCLRNSRGQSMIEYLILVAIIAIGSIAIVKSLGETIYVRFANITNALQNRHEEINIKAPDKSEYKRKGLDDFFKQD